ncbi:MAG: VCBS repeat-containing protein, partial [Cytophagales bacterium]|nr:VCBS repeat-containing protein [Cytophagales bacterium]
TQTLAGLPADRTLTLDYREARRPKTSRATPPATLFAEVTGGHGLLHQHRENDFVDFKIEPLLPHKFSQNGPGLAVGDVNGDGLEDFCVGGPARSPGKVFTQTPSGKFTARDLPDPAFEDQGLLLFDADGDADADLYVVSGGAEFNAGSASYQDRLYRNDGEGNFTRDAAALPATASSGSCVTAADYDRDGDLDLFVGGRVVPGRYPLPAQSYLLRNEGGRFVDVTAAVAPGLEQIGLVTAALWTDFDGDGPVDLIVAGEWMPITFYKNDKGRFTDVTSRIGMAATTGWWNSLAGDDFDGDGDTDYVAGNLGLNTPYKASSAQPFSVYAADFDGNGTVDPVLSYFLAGQEVPVATRDALAVQLPLMRRRFPRYSAYAKASLAEVLSPAERQNAYRLKCEYPQSSYLENRGNGTFTIRPLPVAAQLAPVFGLLTGDYDHDGHADVLLSGNSFAPEFVTGWHDAGSGLYLRGDGRGHFTPVPVAQSGFSVTGDAKGMVQLPTASGGQLVLVGKNNDKLLASVAQKRAAGGIVAALPTDAWAEIVLTGGKKKRQEFYYGSGYLGQSSRTIRLPEGTVSVTLCDFAGRKREVPVRVGTVSLRQ